MRSSRRTAPRWLAVAKNRGAAQRRGVPDAQATRGIHGRRGSVSVGAQCPYPRERRNRSQTTAVVGGGTCGAIEDPGEEAQGLGTMRLGAGNCAAVWRDVD